MTPSSNLDAVLGRQDAGVGHPVVLVDAEPIEPIERDFFAAGRRESVAFRSTWALLPATDSIPPVPL